MIRGRAFSTCVLAYVLAAAQPSADGQIVSPTLRVAEELMKTRSSEQPQPSMRRIELPPGNDLELLHVEGQVYMIAGGATRGNIAVHAGSEGVLLVDTASEDMSDEVLQAVRTLSRGPITYIVTTSADADHYGGNARLGAAGRNPTAPPPDMAGRVAAPDGSADRAGAVPPNPLRPSGAIVLSHERTLHRMSAPAGGTPAAPFALWPTSTFFTATRTLHFNDEPIELRHAANAHTDGDVIAFFRKSDVIAAGDVIDALGYPRIDATRGGGIQGTLDALNTIIEITVPRFNQQGGTRVIPGHGRILNEADVVEYRDMATIVRDRVKRGIDDGMTLEQIQKQRVTLEYDGLHSRPGWTGAMFVEAVYRGLVRR